MEGASQARREWNEEKENIGKQQNSVLPSISVSLRMLVGDPLPPAPLSISRRAGSHLQNFPQDLIGLFGLFNHPPSLHSTQAFKALWVPTFQRIKP